MPPPTTNATNATLPATDLQASYNGPLPDAVRKFVNCTLSLVSYDEKISFDNLASVLPAGLQKLAIGYDYRHLINSPEHKDICCADLVTISYTYALGEPPANDWRGCDQNNLYVGHNAANFYRPCNRNADHLQILSAMVTSLPLDADWLPGDLIVYGAYRPNLIANHVVAYVGPVDWMHDNVAQPQGPCVVSASINTYPLLSGPRVVGSESIFLRRLDLVRNASYYFYDWAQHVRITDLWR